MPEYFTYIIQSTSTKRFYCGFSNDVKRRLKQHNDLNYRGSKTTKKIAGPWTLVWFEKQSSMSVAMQKEKFIKKRGIKRFLEEVAQR